MITAEDAIVYLTNSLGEETCTNPPPFQDASGSFREWAYTHPLAKEGLCYCVEIDDGRRGMMVCDEFWHSDSTDDPEAREAYEAGAPNAYGALRDGLEYVDKLMQVCRGCEPVVRLFDGPFGRHIFGVFVEYKPVVCAGTNGTARRPMVI